MGGIEGQNPQIKFGTHKVELGKSDGVKRETIVKGNNANTMQSIFTKYDKNSDNILDRQELQAFYNDLQSAASNGRMSRAEAKSMAAEQGMDGINRNDLQQFAAALANDFGDTNDGVKAYWGEGDAANTYTVTVADGTTTTTTVKEYADDEHTKLSQQTVTCGDSKTVTSYNEEGKATTREKTIGSGDNITSRTVETFGANGRTIVKRETYGPGGETLKQKEEMVNGKRVTTDYNADGKEIKRTVSEGDQEIVTTIEWAADGSRTETTNGEVKHFDANGNEIPAEAEEAEAASTPESIEYDTNGKVWYNIVREQYHVTDHKTVMAIVHQLKDIAGPEYGKENHYNNIHMPSRITLPTTVTVGNQEFKLTLPEAATPAAAADGTAPATTPPAADGTTPASTPPAADGTTPAAAADGTAPATTPPAADATTPASTPPAAAAPRAAAATTTPQSSSDTISAQGGISGQYTISEDGTLDRSQLSAPTRDNQDYSAYLADYNGHNIKMKGSHYTYRGAEGRTGRALKEDARNKATEIAQETAVYNKLKAKQDAGQTLSAGETKFMQQFMAKLEANGLKFNAETGHVEDINTKHDVTPAPTQATTPSAPAPAPAPTQATTPTTPTPAPRGESKNINLPGVSFYLDRTCHPEYKGQTVDGSDGALFTYDADGYLSAIELSEDYTNATSRVTVHTDLKVEITDDGIRVQLTENGEASDKVYDFDGHLIEDKLAPAPTQATTPSSPAPTAEPTQATTPSAPAPAQSQTISANDLLASMAEHVDDGWDILETRNAPDPENISGVIEARFQEAGCQVEYGEFGEYTITYKGQTENFAPTQDELNRFNEWIRNIDAGQE